MACRITLIQAVNASIPVYAMHSARLPTSTCASLDKLNMDFLWGDCEDKRKVHLANWNFVCKIKFLDSLNIKKTLEMNRAMFAKTSSRILQHDEGL